MRTGFISHILLITGFISLLTACNHQQGNIRLSTIDTIRFDLPYDANMRNLRATDKNAGFSFFSFNTETYKRIDLFDQQGRHLKTISLKAVLATENHIEDITFSNNHFLLLSGHTNNLYSLDTAGNITGIQHFDAPYGNSLLRHINSSLGNTFVLSPGKYLFNCYYYFADTVLPEAHYDHNNDYPYFMTADINGRDSVSTSYRLPHFFTRFLPPHAINICGSVYSADGPFIVLTSPYVDSIYVLNKQTFRIEHIVPIHSEHTAIGVQPVIVSNTEIPGEDELNKRLQTQGGMEYILYDRYRQYYYIALAHSTTREQRKKNGSWSFIVLDSNFRQLGEVKMDEQQYRFVTMLVLEDGILFKRINTAKNEFELCRMQIH